MVSSLDFQANGVQKTVVVIYTFTGHINGEWVVYKIVEDPKAYF